MNLKEAAKKGAKWTAIASLFSAICQLGLTAILARYLDSSAFGLMAIALFVINFSQFFIDMGISNVIIHKQDIKKNELDSLFWLNIILGLIIFLVIYLLSGEIASFYKDKALQNVLIVIATIFLIQPFGAQFSVLLRKYLMFKEIAIRTIVSQGIGFIAGIWLAMHGWGVYALVLSNVVTTLFSTITLIFAGYKVYKPKLHFNFKDIQPFMSFGMYQMGEKVVNYFNHEADTLIVGKLLDISSLGVYNIAKSFVIKPFQVINPILTKISFPIMAKVQDDDLALRKIYKGMIEALSYINFPIFAYMFFFPKDVVLLIFGHEWMAAIIPLKILSLYALLRSTMNPVGTLLLAKGKAGFAFYWNLVQFIFLPVFIYIGSFWGIIGICIILVVFQSIPFSITGTLMIKKICGMPEKEYYGSFIWPLFLTILPVLAMELVVLFYSDYNTFAIIMRGGLFLALYFITVFIFRRKMVLSFLHKGENKAGL
ncbi:MOP flippase family protein [Sphingobacterium siyangense]|uniref:MOP flippase family protein n=1 Tax=Sphingobacterium siyangense TaxID=459529 RepID=UPI003DA2A013